MQIRRKCLVGNKGMAEKRAAYVPTRNLQNFLSREISRGVWANFVRVETFGKDVKRKFREFKPVRITSIAWPMGAVV